MASTEPELHTRTETAQLLHISKRTLHTWIRSHIVEEVRIGGISRISREEIDRIAGKHRDKDDPNTDNK